MCKTKEEARQHAIDWQAGWQEQNYSYGELAEFQKLFTKLGKKFNLTEEFKENGII